MSQIDYGNYNADELKGAADNVSKKQKIKRYAQSNNTFCTISFRTGSNALSYKLQ
jgi:hypothetical protein